MVFLWGKGRGLEWIPFLAGVLAAGVIFPFGLVLNGWGSAWAKENERQKRWKIWA
jgi:hypothetical protein